MSAKEFYVPPDRFIIPPHVAAMIKPPSKPGSGNKIKFVNPNVGNYDRNIRHAAELHKAGMPTMAPNIHKGKTCIVAGSGPSLNDPNVIDSIKRYVEEEDAIVIATKASIKHLHDQGIKVTYGVSMDPGAHIATDGKISRVPGVTHIIASSSDPALFEYLKDEDVWIFHSATGLPTEVQLYNELFDRGDCMGGGFNVVNRAVSCAMYMGFRKLVLAGCDCGWRGHTSFYCDGTSNRPGVDMSDGGMVEFTDEHGQPTYEMEIVNRLLKERAKVETEIQAKLGEDPDAEDLALSDKLTDLDEKLEPYTKRFWFTRPDMLASGVALAKLAKQLGEDRFVILGDSLPAKLKLKDDEFLAKTADFGG